MATLRDPLFRTTSVTAQDLDELRASGMGSLRRGWESGRITNDINANLADEAALRAEGTQEALTKADALARSTAGLRQRAGVYSPEVSRVEGIHGVGDALGWAGGQVGQGVASMADPLAASAALNAAGTAVGLAKNPLAQAASLGLRGAGYVVPYMMSKRQLKGEFYGDISQDPTVMANTTAQQRNDMSDNYGYVAAIPDSAIPGIVGGKFGGAGLRAGVSKIPGAARVAGEILGEGTTELGQEMGKQYAHGLLNPDRDTSQDASANLNSFLGGAVGAGAPVLAGHVADTGFRRVGNTAGVVAEKAGSVVDMAQPYVGKATDAVKAAAGKVRGKVVDMATGEDGTQSAAALKENLKAASQELQSKWQATQEERSTLMSVPPQGVDPNSPEFDAWFVKNTDERTELVAKRLDEMHQAGDQTAGELFRKTFTENGVDQDAMDEAAQYLISQTELGQLEKQANRFGEVAAKGGKLAGKAAVWAARKAGSAAKAFGSAVWDGVQEGSKKNAQDWTGSDVDAEFAQRKQARDEAIKNAVRMSEYLYTTAKTQNNRTASGPIADLLKDMGYEIAELADLSSPSALSAQPDLRRNLTGSQFSLGVNRIVNSLRVAYGPQTEQVVGNLRQMAAPSAAPVFDAMEQELATQRQDKGGAHTAQIRSVAAQELVGLLDADAETKLLKEGINLRAPESQRQLLGMVEAVSLGRAAPQARKALEGLVGRETLNKMLAAVAPQTEQDAEDDTLVDDGGETAEQGFVVNEDGEIGEPASSLYDRESAEKSFTKGQGARMYGFHATRNPRTDLDGKDPFAATTSMTKDEYKAFQQDNIARQAAGEDPLPDPRRRPMLFKKGQTLSEQAGGGLAISKKIADLEKYLKVDRTPERMAALMREEGNEAGAKKVEALIARGDESAKATLGSAMKSFFVNRAGGWRVSPKSAWDVLQEQGAQPTRILSLFRDYLRQDGDNERAEIVGKTLLDEMDQGRGETKGFRVQAGMRKKVKAAAEKYFREHELAVAERLSDRNPGKFDEAELLQMHKSAQKIVDLARKDGGNKVIAAANILTFKSALSPNGNLLHIKVSDLVHAVQQRRNESTGNDFEDTSEYFGSANKNQKYLDLVLDGVGMVMDSGRVDGWPYKINEKNQKEYFGEGQNGVPPSLMLATTTNQGFLFGKDQKANAKAGERVDPIAGPRDPRSVEAARYSMDDADPIEVAKTLGQDGPFVPDSRVEQEPSRYETRHALSDEEYAHWNGLKTPSARSKYLAALRDKYGPEWSQRLDEYGVHGTQFAVFDDLNSERRDVGTRINPQSGAEESVTAPGYRVNRTSTRPHEARTDDPNKTQLDVARKPKGGKSETGAPDEYADQRARSVAQGYNPAAMKDPVERKVDAVARAAERAQPIVEALHRNFAEGVQAVERRLRTAEAPAYTTDKNAAAGGAHYVAPLAHALSAESVAQMDLGPAEAKQIQALRVRVASVLLNGGLKAAEKVALARALFPASAAERITLANVNERLAKVVGKAEAPVKEAGVSDAYLAAENFEDITTNAQADQFLRSAQKRFGELKAMDDLTPMQKKAYAVLDGLFGKSSTADLGSFYQDGRPDADVRKAIAPVKEAGASLGKAQSAPSGALDWSNSGRMRNAQATQIHNDLGRHGFAATHDSPIRHWGKFDWRAHQGKGEGNASFGAGTYLSTANGVHKSYKAQFTKELPGARSFEWDGRLFEYDPDGGEIYIDGVPAKAGSGEYEVAHAILAYGMLPDDALQYARENAYNVVDRSGADVADNIDVSEPNVPSKDLAYVLAALRSRQQIDPDKVHAALKPFMSVERWNRMVVAGDRRAAALKGVDVSALRTPLNAVSPTYQVSVDIEQDQLLDWDAPISEQSPLIQKALRDAGIKTTASVMDVVTGREVETVALDGATIYKNLAKRLGSQAKASDYLQSLGILGHKYAAAGGKNDKFPNYVIYDDTRIHTNYVHFNTQSSANPTQSTQAERTEALAEIRRTLGNKVNVAFADITGYSGEFVDADNLIRISTTPAAGTLQTAYHESLHAFFKQFVRSNPLAMDVIKALAEHKPTLDRVHALLEGYPEAQAALANGEERLAYMYQFWRAGLLDLPYGKPRTLFQKVLKAFRRVLGMVSDLERSTGLLKALASGQVAGDPSVAGKVINKTLAEGTWTRKQLRKMDGLTQMIAAAVLPANDVLASSDSDTAKVLAKTFWANPGDEADGGPNEGYLNARARMAARYTNEFSRFITGLNDRDLKALTEALQQEGDDLDSIAFEPVREAAKRTRELIQRFRKYMVEERGLKLGDRGPNYFPRMWDTAALLKDPGKFMNLMTTKYADMLHGNTEAEKGESALALHHALVSNNMVDGKVLAQRDDGVLTPFFAQGQARLLAWMDGADIAEFQSKDIVKTLTTYFHSGARAAEYASRFGQDGKKLDTALHNIELELVQAAKKRERRGEFSGAEARDKWVQRQMRDVRMAVDAMEGSIGKDGSATMRKIGSAMTVYQNVRLLPLALFSQVVDPMGMLARGATMKQAYESFLRGMKEVGNSWADMFREEPKERQPDRWEKLAMAVGSVDAAMFSHHVAEEYSSTYMSPWAKKINDTFFRVNGMEAWNRGMRVGATKAAVQFIEHHKKHPGEHSVRWLKELGLKPDEILLDDNGELITGWRSAKAAKEGWTDEQARTYIDRLHYAINRWVQGAILTPNAAQRPAWSSDPSYSAFFHLKQFSYSFHKTIMRRAVNELHYGNLAPLASFAWYIPAIIAADVTKGMALNAGELPQHLKGMDLADWVMHGIDRSGMLGVAGIGTDAAADISSLAGPGVEQIIDGFRDELGATTLNALPASPIAKALLN